MFYGGKPLFSQRTAFVLVFLLITVILVGSSLGLVAWIWNQIQARTAQEFPAPEPNPVYVNYDTSGDYLQPASLQAMATYIQEHPEPQNVQVLQGMTTAEIAAYMTNQVSGGLKVDCSYCHNIANFASDEGLPQATNQNISRKALARQMMTMAADLNQNWVTQIPRAQGNRQITCATCHNGQPVFVTYPPDQNTLPDDFRLPLDLEYPGGLTVTGQITKSLEDVELNQYTMYHMNVSLGVGCTHCHNSRYFPSNEIAAKSYAQVMLQMAQHIDRTYKPILNNQTPSCVMCHQGATIPPGAAVAADQVPAVLSTDPPPGTQTFAPISTCEACHPEGNDQVSMSNEQK